LIILIGLLNLTLDPFVELLELLHSFACFSAQVLFGVEWSEIKWTKGVFTINNLEWRFFYGSIWGPIVSKLYMGKQDIPSF